MDPVEKTNKAPSRPQSSFRWPSEGRGRCSWLLCLVLPCSYADTDYSQLYCQANLHISSLFVIMAAVHCTLNLVIKCPGYYGNVAFWFRRSKNSLTLVTPAEALFLNPPRPQTEPKMWFGNAKRRNYRSGSVQTTAGCQLQPLSPEPASIYSGTVGTTAAHMSDDWILGIFTVLIALAGNSEQWFRL